MAEEDIVQSEMVAKFPCLQDQIRIQRARRIFANVPFDRIGEVFDHVVKTMDFKILCTITGLDLGETLGVLYHVAREGGLVLTLATTVPKDQPVVQSVTSYFPAADAYERELVDLFGFQVRGLTPGSRYPLPDGWPAGQYPLRKDWQPQDQAAYPATPKEA